MHVLFLFNIMHGYDIIRLQLGVCMLQESDTSTPSSSKSKTSPIPSTKGPKYRVRGKVPGWILYLSYLAFLFVLCCVVTFKNSIWIIFDLPFWAIDFILTKTSSETQLSPDEMETLELQVGEIMDAIIADGETTNNGSRSQATKDP